MTLIYRAVRRTGLVLVMVAIAGFTGMISSVSVAESQSQHMSKCESELQALYGDDVRKRMVKAKRYQGIHKMTYKVYPNDTPQLVVNCVSDASNQQTVTLTSKAGDILNP